MEVSKLENSSEYVLVWMSALKQRDYYESKHTLLSPVVPIVFEILPVSWFELAALRQ
jgi:hypothetical protein